MLELVARLVAQTTDFFVRFNAAIEGKYPNYAAMTHDQLEQARTALVSSMGLLGRNAEKHPQDAPFYMEALSRLSAETVKVDYYLDAMCDGLSCIEGSELIDQSIFFDKHMMED